MRAYGARLMAPSREDWDRVGVWNALKKGYRPLQRVIVIEFEDGTEMVHHHIFAPDEIEKAMVIIRKIRDGAEINPTHWIKTNPR